MPANQKLPLLELGKDKPTMLNLSVANEVVKTVNGVRMLTFLPAGSARVDIADDQITVTLRQTERPFPVNPYVMRTYLHGSTEPEDTTAPLGLGEANTDTWDRDNPPEDTDGVTIGPEQRHYIFNSGSGTFQEKVFAREKKWDSCGELYYIGPEVEIENATSAGSGSASGGLP